MDSAYIILAGALVIALVLWDRHSSKAQDAPTATETLPDVNARPLEPTQARRMSWVEQAQADHLLRLHADDPQNTEREQLA